MKEKIGYDFDLLCKKFGVDKSRLSRDYGVVPLRRGGGKLGYSEFPPKDDIVYLYNELNLSYNEIIELLAVSNTSWENWRKTYGLHKDNKMAYTKRKQKVCEKLVPKYIDRKLKYAIDLDITKLSRDFIKYPLVKSSNPFIKSERPTKTDLKYLYLELNLTIFEVADVLGCSRSGLIKILNEFKINKDIKQSRISEENFYFKKTGFKNGMQLKINQRKNYESKKNNKSFGTSKAERTIAEKLKTKFGVIEEQYFSEEYPFNCDFYIPSKDLYIEYNGYWAHGRQPFDCNNPKHIKELKCWANKSTEFNHKGELKTSYILAINTWTKRDPLKLKTAQENKLNYKVFYNENEFNKWIEGQ